MNSSALLPRIVEDQGNRLSHKVAVVLGGVGLLSLLAQLAIPLPWTPVPLTGQSFGVALLALLWGRNLGAASMGLYLLLSALGLPLLAQATSLSFGPTFGYLIGMFLASLLVGHLSDRGGAKSFSKAFLCALAGSLCVLGCGLLVLSYFMPTHALLATGLWPFLPGDLVKNLGAAWIAVRLGKLK